jgi:hypothetical protein
MIVRSNFLRSEFAFFMRSKSIMRSKFSFFMISNLSIRFYNFDQEFYTLIRWLTLKINVFFSFNLMIVVVTNKSNMPSKFKKAL